MRTMPTMPCISRPIRVAGLACVLLLTLGCDESTSEPQPASAPITARNARLAGQIVDAIGQGVQGASVRIPFGDRQQYATSTDASGKYSMDVPVAPFANVSPLMIFATKDGYRPLSVTYARLEEGRLYAFGAGTGQSLKDLAPGEFVPAATATLVHIGDDSYGGEPNSQLQVQSRGIDLVFRITSWTPALATARNATISFLARGIQTSRCPSNYIALISAAGAYQGVTPPNSDPGGNFSQYNLNVAIPAMSNGTDIALRVISGRCTNVNDYDDFEIGALVVRFNY